MTTKHSELSKEENVRTNNDKTNATMKPPTNKQRRTVTEVPTELERSVEKLYSG